MTDADAAVTEGSPAPDFTLSSGTGEIITLSNQLRQGHAVLYFFREFS